MIKKNSSVSYVREAIALGLTVINMFILIALLTYNSEDISLTYASTRDVPIENACGFVGACIASFLFYFFGYSSYILVLIMFFYAYVIMFNRIEQEKDRAVAVIFFLLSTAGLCAIHKLAFIQEVFSPGILGTYIYAMLYVAFDRIGASIILMGIWLISVVVMMRFSILLIINKIAKAHYYFLAFIVQKVMHKGAFDAASVYINTVCGRIYMMGQSMMSGKIMQNSSNVFLEGEQRPLRDSVVDIIAQDAFWHEFTHTSGSDYIKPHNQALEGGKEGIKSAVDVAHKNDFSGQYQKPNGSIFKIAPEDDEHQIKHLHNEQQTRAKILEEKLMHFGINGSVVSISRGPVITLFEYQPHIDIKVSKIISLEHDLALALQATSIRILAPIPGKSVVGFEVANQNRKKVSFVKLLTSTDFSHNNSQLPIILGEDTVGKPCFADLVSLPHLLIAGSTGSGKSVALNGVLMSLIYKVLPADCKLILIDPKRLEFAVYADIPHLLVPPVTQPRQAIVVLQWLVHEMERRYELLAEHGVKNINDYRALKKGALPFIVVIIDELADLMMVAGREIEDLIVRLAQMARAAGIHLIVATQRPSVDVITGLIKVNFPSRMALRVTSATDSRTILDSSGAEKLVGKGDMLFLEAQSAFLKRIHGAYVTDVDIQTLVNYLREQQQPEYLSNDELIIQKKETQECDDDIYQDVLTFLQEVDEISISLLQRKFRIGYNRSARIIEMLESQGRIMPADSGKTRKVIR